MSLISIVIKSDCIRDCPEKCDDDSKYEVYDAGWKPVDSITIACGIVSK